MRAVVGFFEDLILKKQGSCNMCKDLFNLSDKLDCLKNANSHSNIYQMRQLVTKLLVRGRFTLISVCVCSLRVGGVRCVSIEWGELVVLLRLVVFFEIAGELKSLSFKY